MVHHSCVHQKWCTHLIMCALLSTSMARAACLVDHVQQGHVCEKGTAVSVTMTVITIVQ